MLCNHESNSRIEKNDSNCLYDVYVKCDDSAIPLRILTKSKGTIVFNQTSKNVSFVNHFPDVQVNMACNDMILRHENRIRENPHMKITHQVTKILTFLFGRFTFLDNCPNFSLSPNLRANSLSLCQLQRAHTKYHLQNGSLLQIL